MSYLPFHSYALVLLLWYIILVHAIQVYLINSPLLFQPEGPRQVLSSLKILSLACPLQYRWPQREQSDA